MTLSNTPWKAIFFALLLPHTISNAAEVQKLSIEEQTWIKSHPVIRIAIDPQWKPLEFSEKGVSKGLSAAYLKEIEKETGLRFQLIETSRWKDSLNLIYSGEADVLPATSPDVHEPEGANGRLIYSRPYYVGSTTIVSRADIANIFDSSDFDGMTVALNGGGMFESWIRRSQPKATVITYERTDDVLDAVVSGKAQVAIGPELVLHKLLRQRYPNQLHIAGTIPSLPLTLRIATRADSPILISIFNKVLAGLSAEKTDLIYQEWAETADYGQPSWTAIAHYYGKEIVLGSLTFFFLFASIYYMRRAKRIAEDNEKQKAMFLAVMSHEIRTPINAVLASIELLQNTALNTHQNRLLHTAVANAEILSTLLNDVLDYSKLEAGAINLEYISTDVKQLVHQALACIEVRAKEKGLEIEATFAEEIPRLRLDPTRIRQILTNILSNAAKFTDKGSIRILTHLQETTNSTPKLTIEVKDTGMGIPSTAISSIFTPFRQASSSITREFGGSGLGLAICAELIKEMNGSIGVISQQGEGTTVTISIPTEICTLETASDLVRSDYALPSASHLHNILLIEDVLVNQELIREQLLLLGYSCAVAADGSSGIEQFNATRFAAVLLDCHLPMLSGYEVALKMRDIEERNGFSYTPIIAISADSGETHIQKCFASGIDGTLSKPIRLERLRETLALWLPTLDTTESPQGLDVQYSATTIASSLNDDYIQLEKATIEQDYSTSTHYSHRIKGLALLVDAQHILAAIQVLDEEIARKSPALMSAALNQVKLSIQNYIATPAR